MEIYYILVAAFSGIIVGLMLGVSIALKLYERYQEKENKIVKNVKEYLEGNKNERTKK